MIKISQLLLEHKFWGKTISEFLSWIQSKSNKYWIVLDTETTGLNSDNYEVQLTQISCLVMKYNFSSNTFKEVDSFNKKIKLTPKTTELMKDPNSRIPAVLKFNHYEESELETHEEENVLQYFFEFLKKYDNPVLIIQNAIFDMRYLNTRHPIVRFDNEVIDTKQIIQLFYLPLLQKLAETQEEYKEVISKIGISDRDNGLVSSSMSKVGPALGINMSGYHDALVDCRIATEMLQKMISFLKHHQEVDIKKYQLERIQTSYKK